MDRLLPGGVALAITAFMSNSTALMAETRELGHEAASRSEAPRVLSIDLDGDGLQDLLRYVPGGEAQILIHQPDGSFSLLEDDFAPILAGLEAALRVDLDADGRDELVLVHEEATLIVELSDGAPQVMSRLAGGRSVETLDVGDDGLVDLIVDNRLVRQEEIGHFVSVALPEAPLPGSPPRSDFASARGTPNPLLDHSGNVASRGVNGDLVVTGNVHAYGEGANRFAGPLVVGEPSGVATLQVQGSLPTPITGVVTISKSAIIVLGVGTRFTEELRLGDALTIADATSSVVEIVSDNQLSIDTPHPTGALDVPAYVRGDVLEVTTEDGTPSVTVDRAGLVTLHEGVAGPLHVEGGGDVTPTGGGSLIIGNVAGDNIAMDVNEIMARNNQEVSTLYVNNNGGNVAMMASGTGNLGVGTSTPDHRLDLGTGLGKKLAVYQNTSNTSFYGFGISTGALELYAGSEPEEEPAMVIRSDGDVNIGEVPTGNYSGTLNVNYEGDHTTSKIAMGYRHSGVHSWHSGDGEAIYGVGLEGADAVKAYVATGTGYALHVTGKTNLSGNVGINEPDPTESLSIRGHVVANGYQKYSDCRYKREIAPITDALAAIGALEGVSFEWDPEADPYLHFNEGRQLGLIAQEVREVLPEVVRENDAGYLSVAYGSLVPVLIEAIQEQQKIIDAGRERMEDYEDLLLAQESDLTAVRSAEQTLRARLTAVEEALEFMAP